jgi:predicted ABC-type ATPase
MSKKRLRVFAGPNGSGKSTIFKYIDSKIGCPYFVNADEIQASLSLKGVLNFDKFAIMLDKESFIHQLVTSSWAEKITKIEGIIDSIDVQKNRLIVPTEYVDGYFSAFVADFIRNGMLNVVHQFTIETVLSDRRKLEYIKSAKNLGYRIYLYFVSTKDVEINIKRVSQRVSLGGHNVPEDKIRSRYQKSLEILFDTLKLCDRAYLFDNSEEKWVWLAELDQDEFIIRTDTIPAWLNDHVLAYL